MAERRKAAHECLVEADGAEELLLPVLIQNTDGFFLISAGTELKRPSVFRLFQMGNVQPCQVKGKALLVIIPPETAHRCQKLVQIRQVNIRLLLSAQF